MVLAQTGTPPVVKTSPVIAIKIDTIGCNTAAGANTFAAQSWTFGASLPSSSIGGGIGSGKVNIQNLNIVKAFDECSPKLFTGVTGGQRQATLTLTQTDAGGKNLLMTIKLQTVGVASYQLVGSPASDQPSEQVSFSFTKISITNHVNGVTSNWDIQQNKTF